MRDGALARLTAYAAMALLLLALLPARSQLDDEPAHQRQCLSNLKTLYQACVAYAADHDGQFPSSQTIRPAPQVWGWWFDELKPYLPDPRVCCCPSSKQAEEYGVWDPPEPLLPAVAFSPYWVSYGMTWWFSPDHDKRAPFKPTQLADPANTPLFADSRGYLISAAQTGWMVDARHHGRVQVVLANGETVTATVDPKDDGTYRLVRLDGRALSWGP